MAQTLLWYDLETFGTVTLGDRIAQYAAIRTTDSFEPLGEPTVLYNRITPDYLPNPYACLITGITPQHTLEHGLREYDFISQIRSQMMVPGTTTLGYNSIKFDDEFIRATLYRNFYDPYEREWMSGNSRWDVLDLARAAHDLRPEGINWSLETNQQGEKRPSFRLELLTKANGISHESAHDALSDVRATIAIAKLIHDHQPKLFRFYFSNRKKEQQRQLIDLKTMPPLVHTSGTHSNPKGCTTLIVPLAYDLEIKNNLIALDLRYDPCPLLDLSVEEIQRRVFTKREELEAEEDLAIGFNIPQHDNRVIQEGFGGRIPILTIPINKCPFLAPLEILRPEDADRLGISIDQAMKHRAILSNYPELTHKILSIFQKDQDRKLEKDPDFMLYSGGFFKDEDKQNFTRIHETLTELPVEQAKHQLYNLHFSDTRIPQMLRRFFARNFPESMNQKELTKWENFCAKQILSPPSPRMTDMPSFSKIMISKMESNDTPARQKVILRELMEYHKGIKRKLLGQETGTMNDETY
jgi:exodeoxyribonuclease-1